MRIFYLLFMLYGVSHIYIFISLRRAFSGGKWQIPVIVWLLAMASVWLLRFGRPAGPVGEKFQDLGFIWMGLLVFLCYCLITADVLALLSRIFAWITHSDMLRSAAAWMTAPRYVPIAIGVALALFAYSLFEAQTPRIREVSLHTEKLAPGSPAIRIAAISDVHVSSMIGPRMLSRMVKKINAQEPDILLLCGDLVDSDLNARPKDAEVLRGIKAPLGKFAVTGNHESYHGLQMSLRFMEKSGLRILRGETVEAGGIAIAGVDDSNFAGRFTPDTTDVLRVLDEVPQGKYILIMNHKPRYPEGAVGRFDLMFSGHTHGGQFWPGMYITRSIYEKEQGMNVLKENGRKSLLYVSNGIGFWGPPIRFLAPPEIVMFTIAPE